MPYTISRSLLNVAIEEAAARAARAELARQIADQTHGGTLVWKDFNLTVVIEDIEQRIVIGGCPIVWSD